MEFKKPLKVSLGFLCMGIYAYIWLEINHFAFLRYLWGLDTIYLSGVKIIAVILKSVFRQENKTILEYTLDQPGHVHRGDRPMRQFSRRPRLRRR